MKAQQCSLSVMGRHFITSLFYFIISYFSRLTDSIFVANSKNVSYVETDLNINKKDS